MDKEILLKVLQLDSITHCLDWEDRIRTHLYLNGRARVTSPKILAAVQWIEKWHWIAPEMRYGQDRLLYYENASGEWRPVEELKDIMKPIKI